ncbi:MAG: ChbG/HpnK family deacetylase [Ignavibacteriales bacterium]|nr:ChbG/HpnK family deacetylase [Ignavibacteriales bacterium]
MKYSKLVLIAIILFCSASFPQSSPKKLLIRCDDIGMCHSVNMALVEMIKTETPFSASVMVCCPWYQEAVEILKNHPEVSVGIHLTLNAEWKNYRWGPVLGKEAVPSLVDSCGYFFPSRAKLYANNPNVEDVEKELRAQVERAMYTGLKIDYVDYHMGTAVDKPEYRKIVEKLAAEFHLGISRYFGEIDTHNMYDAPIEFKADTLSKILSNLKDNQTGLLVCHIGVDTPELQAMIDLNQFGLPEMSKHRNAELKSLTSKAITQQLKKDKINLLTYRSLINQIGFENMKAPKLEDD